MSIEDILKEDLKKYEGLLEENKDVSDEKWWKQLYEIYFHIRKTLQILEGTNDKV